MKVIILEGMDGVGKTTLTLKLIQNLRGRMYLHHFMFPKGDSIEEKYGYQRGQFQLLFDTLHMLNQRNDFDYVILDRSHIGEYVWGPFLRERFPMYLPALENKHRDLDVSVILVTGDDEDVIRQRWEERDEPFPEHFSHVQSMFKDAMHITPFPAMMLDSTEMSPEEMLMEADIFIHQEKYK